MNRKDIVHFSHKYKISIEFIQRLLNWFDEEEIKELISMKSNNLRKTVRFNLLNRDSKIINKQLKTENILVEKLPDIPEGWRVRKGMNRIGNSISYLSGNIYPQGYGSMLSVHALDPKPGEFILDMAAAPGGKTTFIAERMKNQGVLISNDKNTKRIQSLINNLSRHGITNTVVTMMDAQSIRLHDFDRILLDAPCTGEGLIVSQPVRRMKKTNPYNMQRLQILLLRHAINIVKPGGVIVYSTCSISPIENEEVVNKFLDQVSIEKITISGDSGLVDFDRSFINARRLLPSKHYCDGFFIVKLRKKS